MVHAVPNRHLVTGTGEIESERHLQARPRPRQSHPAQLPQSVVVAVAADSQIEGAQPSQSAEYADAVDADPAFEMLQLRQQGQSAHLVFAQETINQMQLPQHDAIGAQTAAAAAVPAMCSLTAQPQLLPDFRSAVVGTELQHFESGRESDGAREG